jgi:hypothetical protein
MRHQFDDTTSKSLTLFSDLIKDFTDLGLEVWTKQLNEKENITTDLPANLLFRQILEASDGIYELIRVGCINICKPLLRTCLECYWQLAFILKDDDKRKARHFLYHYNKAKLHDLENVLFPNNKNSLANKLSKDRNLKELTLSETEKDLGWKDYYTLQEILNSDENRETAKEYGEKKMKSWYHYFIKSQKIEDLAIQLEESGLYEILFRNLSSFIHGEDILHSNVVFYPNEKIGLKYLRDIEQVDFISNSTIIILRKSILLFLQKRMSSEKDSFVKLKSLAEKFNGLQRK